MHQTTPLVLAVLVRHALVSERVNRLFVAPALIFMFAGMALGPFGFQLLDAGPGTEGYTVLRQLALALILFNQAAESVPGTGSGCTARRCQDRWWSASR